MPCVAEILQLIEGAGFTVLAVQQLQVNVFADMTAEAEHVGYCYCQGILDFCTSCCIVACFLEVSLATATPLSTFLAASVLRRQGAVQRTDRPRMVPSSAGPSEQRLSLGRRRLARPDAARRTATASATASATTSASATATAVASASARRWRIGIGLWLCNVFDQLDVRSWVAVGKHAAVALARYAVARAHERIPAITAYAPTLPRTSKLWTHIRW